MTIILLIVLLYFFPQFPRLVNKIYSILRLLGLRPGGPSQIAELIPKMNPSQLKSRNPSQLKSRNRRVSGYTKKLVAAQQQWKCMSCQMMLHASYEVDHIIPLQYGGSNKRDNLQALCRNCHGEKTFRNAVVH